MNDRGLYIGFIRVHILYHASQGPIFGLGIIAELGRHGYQLSPGTLYPILHNLEKKGYLRSQKELEAGRTRRIYTATEAGRAALEESKAKLAELIGELYEKGRDG